MVYGYKDEKYLGCSTDAETLEKALKMVGIDTTGMEISDKPPEPPTHEPTTEEKIAELDAQFRVDRATIMEYYTQAVFDNDTKTQEELKTEMEDIKDAYAEERKKIKEAD